MSRPRYGRPVEYKRFAASPDLEGGDAHHLPVTLRMKEAACHRSGAADNRVEATAGFFRSDSPLSTTVSCSPASPAALGGRAGGPRSQRFPCTERRRAARNSSHHPLQNTSKSNIPPPKLNHNDHLLNLERRTELRKSRGLDSRLRWVHTHTRTRSPSPFLFLRKTDYGNLA